MKTTREKCPQDGNVMEIAQVIDSHQAIARCPRCGGNYPVHGEFSPEDAKPLMTVEGKARLFERCPYDQGSLVVVHKLTYAGMAEMKCTTPHCLFAITQGDAE